MVTHSDKPMFWKLIRKNSQIFQHHKSHSPIHGFGGSSDPPIPPWVMAAMAWADSKQAGHAVERQQKIYESFRVAILKVWKSGEDVQLKAQQAGAPWTMPWFWGHKTWCKQSQHLWSSIPGINKNHEIFPHSTFMMYLTHGSSMPITLKQRSFFLTSCTSLVASLALCSKSWAKESTKSKQKSCWGKFLLGMQCHSFMIPPCAWSCCIRLWIRSKPTAEISMQLRKVRTKNQCLCLVIFINCCKPMFVSCFIPS